MDEQERRISFQEYRKLLEEMKYKEDSEARLNEELDRIIQETEEEQTKLEYDYNEDSRADWYAKHAIDSQKLNQATVTSGIISGTGIGTAGGAGGATSIYANNTVIMTSFRPSVEDLIQIKIDSDLKVNIPISEYNQMKAKIHELNSQVVEMQELVQDRVRQDMAIEKASRQLVKKIQKVRPQMAKFIEEAEKADVLYYGDSFVEELEAMEKALGGINTDEASDRTVVRSRGVRRSV